jgi:glycosyltransferase involved in cell wall biosynthesis
MRVAFFYPERTIGRPIDPAEIWTSPRGLTGSEVACVMYALELSRMGHGVTFFSRLTRGGNIEDVVCCHYGEWESMYKEQHWDALCSWMVPDPLEVANPAQFRLYNQQVSDFNMVHAGWESKVDFVAPLSHSHANHMLPMCSLPKEKWRVMYNGVDTKLFHPKEKVPGKVVWASSHDRGLHWLLELWPKVRAEVPNAELHIFYDFNGVETFSKMENATGEYAELGQRSRYTVEAIRRLAPHGVRAHKSVSRERIRDEMATAQVLAYPCDPVRYTETFGVTVLEACASGAIPVICTADAFGELWSEASLFVPPPFKDNKGRFVEKLVFALKDDIGRATRTNVCVDHAEKFNWRPLAKGLSTFLESRGEEGLPEVRWDR